jgi:RimJ/RimL family protein N-acetyltransferase
MTDYVIEICKEKKLETIYANIIIDNKQAINLLRKMGFRTEMDDSGTVKAVLNLKEY